MEFELSTEVKNFKKKKPKADKITRKELHKRFVKWLFDGDINSKIDREVVKTTNFNAKYFLAMFCNEPAICLFMNAYFNNIYFYGLDNEEICVMVKKIIITNGIQKHHRFFSFYKQWPNADIKKINKFEPHLNYGECKHLYKLMLKDGDLYKKEFETMGLETVEVKVKKINTLQADEEEKVYVDLTKVDNVIHEDENDNDLVLIDTQCDGEYMFFVMLDLKTGKKKIKLGKPTFWYWSHQSSQEMSVRMDECRKIEFNTIWDAKQYNDKCKTYEKDVSIESLHTRDYYQNTNESEAVYNIDTMFYDIEVYAEKFPDPKIARWPVNAITWCIGDKVKTYVLQNDKKCKIEKYANDPMVEICRTEYQLLEAFLTDVMIEDPFVLTGWNSDDFDWPYIYNRLKKKYPDLLPLTYKYSSKSAVKNDRWGDIKHFGYIHMDMLKLYKMYTFNVMESYRLDFITHAELGAGKVQLDTDIAAAYDTDIDKFIEYNIRDTTLLKDLNDKLKHIELTNEIRKIAQNSWKNVMTTMGFVDNLIIQKMHSGETPQVIQTADKNYEKGEMAGAYVRKPLHGGGLFKWVIDFDAKSLYPSIIQSFNMGVNTYMFKFVKQSDCDMYLYENELFLEKESVDVYVKPHVNDLVIKTIPMEKFLDVIEKNKVIVNPFGTAFKGHEIEMSWYSDIFVWLANSRTEYKNEMFKCKDNNDKDGEALNNIRQLVYKVAMNSIYGLLSSTHYRCATVDIGASTTLAGQHLIKYTAVKTNELIDTLSETL